MSRCHDLMKLGLFFGKFSYFGYHTCSTRGGSNSLHCGDQVKQVTPPCLFAFRFSFGNVSGFSVHSVMLCFKVRDFSVIKCRARVLGVANIWHKLKFCVKKIIDASELR